MSKLRVIVLGETSPSGKLWLRTLEEQSVLEVHAAPDQSSIFEDYDKVGEVPVVLIENISNSQNEILALRKSGYPNYIIWFGGNFTKQDYEFALEHRVYAVFEKPEAEDEKNTNIFNKLQFNKLRSSHFTSLVQGLKSVIVQITSSDEQHPLFSELKAATAKLEDLEGQNEFCSTGSVHANKFEHPVFANSKEDLGDAIESMEDLERTGALWIRGTEPGEEGRIEFLQGKIVFSEAGEATGLKAIYRMFLWQTPKFLFARELANEVPFDDESVKYPIDLITQGRRLKLAYESIKEELPPASIVLAINAESVVDKLELNGSDFNVLSSVIQFGRVSEIVDYTPMPDAEIYQSLINLRKLNLIQVGNAG